MMATAALVWLGWWVWCREGCVCVVAVGFEFDLPGEIATLLHLVLLVLLQVIFVRC